MFLDFLCHAANRGTNLARLYILGDLFDYWVGDDGGESVGAGAVETAIKKCTDAGVKIFFMHGNRDFLIGNAFAARTGCTLLPDPSRITLDGRDFVLTHGDALCTDDHEHQQSRREMLSDKWRIAFLSQPVEHRIDAAIAMRNRSEAGKQHKSAAVMDVKQDAVEKLMRAHQVDTLIHGHTHRPAVHQFELDHKPAWRYVLGDWYEQRSALYYAHGKLALKK